MQGDEAAGVELRGSSVTLSRRDFVRLGGASLAGAVLLGVGGCGGEETIGGEQGEAGSVFDFGQGVDAVSLDPINQADDTSSDVASHIFSTLLQYPLTGSSLVPALAVEVPEPEDDGRTYTFRLREGVKFHDGADFNAEAVKFNFDRWRDSKNPYHKGGGAGSSDFSLYALLFGGFDEESVVQKVEVLDERTVRVGLREPLGPFLNNLAQVAFSIASPKGIREDVENFWKQPVGTGPFEFVSWTRGSKIVLKKNSDWWGKDTPERQGGGGPYLDQVVFQSIPDNTSRAAALTAGELSGAVGLVPDDLPSIEQNPDLTVVYRPPLTLGHISMNTQKEPFGDVRVRRAVAHAVNVPEIVEAFFGSTGEVAGSPMPLGLSFFNEGIKPYGYDPAESKRLLEEAGLADGFDTNLWYISIPRPYVPDGKGIAQAVQSDLRKVGINAELVTYEFGTYLEKVGMGEHDMALYGGTDAGTDPDFRLYYWYSSAAATETNASNTSYYKNKEVDELIARARSTVDEEERRGLYYRVQEIVHEDVPVLPLAYVRDPVGLQQRVEGYHTTLGGDRFNTVKLSGGA
jgi:peptide/nickel transport system substrate-binding protein